MVQKRPSKRPLIIGCGVMVLIGFGLFFLLNTLGDKVKQRRTQAVLRTVGTAVEAYASDHKVYPSASTPGELVAALTPTYIRQPTGPEDTEVSVFSDEWGQALRYQCWQNDPRSAGCDSYAVVSPGADGKFEQDDARKYVRGSVTSVDDDLVYSNGDFIRRAGN